MVTVSTRRTSVRIAVQGIVQGVGFRPFVYRLAQQMELGGSIANNGEGVRIHITGAPERVDRFIERLRNEAPPIARIVSLDVTEAMHVEKEHFVILPSSSSTRPKAQIPPDISVCGDCLQEMMDPADRRYHYPFINCTNCGPRFSIIRSIPYDRDSTSMAVFPMCEACSREYHDPLNRRFHAQPNACPACGPSLSWHDPTGLPLPGNDPVAQAARALAAGRVVAIKGLGGFHLAVDACSDQAVARLRQRKHRKGKPLAVMFRDMATVRLHCQVSPLEEQILCSPEHPIVLLERKDPGLLAADLADGLAVLGVMLPYTPLHYLLLHHGDAPTALVMTSGNLSNEPICTDNDEALTRLGGIADYFLLHNRDILTRVDDSLVRVMAGKPRLLRRGRGYAPVPLLLQHPCADIFASGAEMKNSFCLVRSGEAYISQHIGEMTSPQCLDFYTESIAHLSRVLATKITAAACDMHPDYLASRHAEDLHVPLHRIQHHHAHAAAVMAEHGLEGPVLAVILDGSGYGGDHTVFGGECYLVDRRTYTRLGHLRHLSLPGGDQAVREPWRMGLALFQAGAEETPLPLPSSLESIAQERLTVVRQMIAAGVNTPLTSSCGRLFDAVAALLGICLYADYEGQAAMQVEALATGARCATLATEQTGYPVRLVQENDLLQIDTAPLAALLLSDTRHHSPGLAALRFHNWLIDAVAALLLEVDPEVHYGVVLGGGCMQNRILLEGLISQIEAQGRIVHAGEMIPANDGGIALGQAYIGGYRPCA
ncbi:MAG: carbamoyltransferase HypF [Deltaproteobacteria bacterium]|nr:MAG: carbamoyltransferase HypF [Deltaproteobacteria bacterium]